MCCSAPGDHHLTNDIVFEVVVTVLSTVLSAVLSTGLLSGLNVVNDNLIPLAFVVLEELVVNSAFLIAIVGVFILESKNQTVGVGVINHASMCVGWFTEVTVLDQGIGRQHHQALLE